MIRVCTPVLLAWYSDYRRLKKLERKGVFSKGFSDEAAAGIRRTLLRVAELAVIDRIKPYDGPIER